MCARIVHEGKQKPPKAHKSAQQNSKVAKITKKCAKACKYEHTKVPKKHTEVHKSM